MTNAEKEMRKFLECCACLQDLVFHDQMVIGQLNSKINVKISFYGGIEADSRHSLLVEIINKESGKIDATSFHFSNIIGRVKMNNGDMTNRHLWKGFHCNEFEWYCGEPSKAERKKIMDLVYAYINLYK